MDKELDKENSKVRKINNQKTVLKWNLQKKTRGMFVYFRFLFQISYSNAMTLNCFH